MGSSGKTFSEGPSRVFIPVGPSRKVLSGVSSRVTLPGGSSRKVLSGGPFRVTLPGVFLHVRRPFQGALLSKPFLGVLQGRSFQGNPSRGLFTCGKVLSGGPSK